jgi:hypothetical protein
MATREFEFIVGPETSELPAIGTPSADDDLISLGYARENYVQGGESVADITALKAVADDANRNDGDIRHVRSTDNTYRYDSASAAAGDDNFIVVPDAGSGRWLRLTILNRANTFTDTTDSTSKDTGAMILEGGLGVEKNVHIGGNLTVEGTTTAIESSTLEVTDANVTVNKGGTQATADAQDSGFTVEMSDATNVQVGYDSTLTSRFKVGDIGAESEIITAGHAQTITAQKTHSSSIIMDNQQGIEFREDGGSGTNKTTVKSPATLAGDLDFIFPDNAGAAGQFLKTDGFGNTDWASPGVAGQVTTDASAGGGAGSVTISSGSTLTHPKLTITAGDTYTINGTMVNLVDVTIDGTLTITGQHYVLGS